VKTDTIINYIENVLRDDVVGCFLAKHMAQLIIPEVVIVPSCGPRAAALTYGHRRIEVSSWLLVDEEETFLVARHECAHVVQDICKIPGTPHGKAYTNVLKIVSPQSWREDKYWVPNIRIEEARRKLHPKSKSLLR